MNTQIVPYEEKVWLFEDQAKAIQVTDQASLTRASELLLAGKDLEKTIRAYFAPLKQAAHTAWKAVCDRENLELSRITPITERLNRAAADYTAEQERKRLEAITAIRRAEDQRRQIEEKALREAQEAEMRARAAKNEEDRERARAEVDAILDKAIEEETKLVPSFIIPEAPKSEGLSMRDCWDFEITDEALIPREYLVPDESKLRRVVKAMKDKTNIPGIRAVNRPIMARTGLRGEQEHRV